MSPDPNDRLRLRWQLDGHDTTMQGLSRALFVLSIVVLSVIYGSASAVFHWFPGPQIRQAINGVQVFAENWRNDLQLEPTRHLVDAPPGRAEFEVHLPKALTPGHVLIAGLTKDRETLQGATLYDEQGQELHHWPLDYDAMHPNGAGEYNVMHHGLAAYPDGSLIVAFDNGDVLARVDACGSSRWVQRKDYHHAVSANADGTVWSWRKDKMSKVNAATGQEIAAIDLRTDLVESEQLHGILGIRSIATTSGYTWGQDPFHANDVEELGADMADAFPGFAAGDLLISLRELNFIGVLDPQTRRFKWYRHGPWFKQHDPDFQPDGTISVFDNRMGLDASRIVSIDPQTDELTELVRSTDATPFYSWRRGKHQILANGNVLITEAERGRVFEVTPEGRLVWERNMVFDEQHNHVVTSATQLRPDFFEPGALTCNDDPS